MSEVADLKSDAIGKLQNAWQQALAGPRGEIILNDLQFYAQQQAHVPGDPYSTAFNDGMRQLATNIIFMAQGEDDVPTKPNVIK